MWVRHCCAQRPKFLKLPAWPRLKPLPRLKGYYKKKIASVEDRHPTFTPRTIHTHRRRVCHDSGIR